MRPLIAGIAIRLIVLHAKARLPMLGATVQTGARRTRVKNGRKGARVLAFGRYFGNREEYDARVPEDKMISSEEYFVDERKRGYGAKVWRICITPSGAHRCRKKTPLGNGSTERRRTNATRPLDAAMTT